MYLDKVAVHPPNKVRIWPKFVDCIFIGYVQNINGYRFLVYDPKIPDIHKNTLI